MSDESKKKINEIKENFKRVEEGTRRYVRELGGSDKDLTKKLEKVQKEAGEVVKHIEKRTSEG